jgi:pimeloyl-ACP methyl ester carboxylesterase
MAESMGESMAGLSWNRQIWLAVSRQCLPKLNALSNHAKEQPMNSRKPISGVANTAAAGHLQPTSDPQPCSTTLPFLTARTATVQACRISYRIGGTGPCLLLLHGFTLNSSQWDPFLERLSRSHTVIVPDLPGHGGSEADDGPFSFVRTAERMHGLLQQLGVVSAACIGHSAGAVTALHMATQQPRSIEAMVLVAGPHRLDAQARALARDERFDALDAQTQSLYLSLHPGGRPQIDRIFGQFNRLGGDDRDFEVSVNRLAAISTPALLVWGDRDPYFTVESGLALYRVLRNAQLMVWPGQGHTPVWPSLGGSPLAAESFPAVLDDFFSRAAAERPAHAAH